MSANNPNNNPRKRKKVLRSRDCSTEINSRVTIVKKPVKKSTEESSESVKVERKGRFLIFTPIKKDWKNKDTDYKKDESTETESSSEWVKNVNI